jgi:hypothetical protein
MAAGVLAKVRIASVAPTVCSPASSRATSSVVSTSACEAVPEASSSSAAAAPASRSARSSRARYRGLLKLTCPATRTTRARAASAAPAPRSARSRSMTSHPCPGLTWPAGSRASRVWTAGLKPGGEGGNGRRARQRPVRKHVRDRLVDGPGAAGQRVAADHHQSAVLGLRVQDRPQPLVVRPAGIDRHRGCLGRLVDAQPGRRPLPGGAIRRLGH